MLPRRDINRGRVTINPVKHGNPSLLAASSHPEKAKIKPGALVRTPLYASLGPERRKTLPNHQMPNKPNAHTAIAMDCRRNLFETGKIFSYAHMSNFLNLLKCDLDWADKSFAIVKVCQK